MKKYHQLFLLIVSISSLSLFLIYRHEYNRLHYILEVFNFFGQPCNFSQLQKSSGILMEHDWGPKPYFQQDEAGLVYSSFLLDKQVKTLLLVNDERKIAKGCFLWLENRKKPILGLFSYQKVGTDNNLYAYNCKFDSLNNNFDDLYAVSYSFRLKNFNNLTKIQIVVNNDNERFVFNATICVLPNVYSKKKLVEFLSFHKIIGVDSFIVYDKEIPYKLVKFITNLNMNVSFFKFNIGANNNNVVKSLIETDCFYRTKKKSKFVAVLELNEYLTVKNNNNNNNYINKIQDVSFNNKDKTVVTVQKICLDFINNKPIVLENFQVNDDFVATKIIYNNYNDKNVDFNKNTVVINKYVKCNLEPKNSHTDRFMQIFTDDLYGSVLVQLLIKQQI
ncbi:uncharacterized protein LOC126266006 [Aethina tumida]|uniref:uncharacterized protein LOC126266006 n=1 Tax=Aethina tumida TaxID=116153 RepID=UPI00214832C4|nr:uncharacterized protein LOC126266006 [Aethina tumida]